MAFRSAISRSCAAVVAMAACAACRCLQSAEHGDDSRRRCGRRADSKGAWAVFADPAASPRTYCCCLLPCGGPIAAQRVLAETGKAERDWQRVGWGCCSPWLIADSRCNNWEATGGRGRLCGWKAQAALCRVPVSGVCRFGRVRAMIGDAVGIARGRKLCAPQPFPMQRAKKRHRGLAPAAGALGSVADIIAGSRRHARCATSGRAELRRVCGRLQLAAPPPTVG